MRRQTVSLKVILFGATGMVGQGVLRECLLGPDVTQVLSVARSSTGQKHDKLRELLHDDVTDGHSFVGFVQEGDSAGRPSPYPVPGIALANS